MKALFLFIFFLAAGIYSASAQQKTRDVLFPDYAADQARLNKAANSQVKPVEATLTSRDAILNRIFTNYQKPTAKTTLRPASKAPAATLPSFKSAEESDKEVKAQREALKGKTITPKTDQGPESTPKPKN